MLIIQYIIAITIMMIMRSLLQSQLAWFSELGLAVAHTLRTSQFWAHLEKESSHGYCLVRFVRWGAGAEKSQRKFRVKPMEEHDNQFTRGLSAVYQRDDGCSSFLAADKCTWYIDIECIYIYIYIERERERYTCICISVCIYIYIYI